MQILYGVSGERRLPELELSWLPGYEKSAPVRTGNAASNQFQLDVYGEIASSMYHAQCAGIAAERPAWDLLISLMDFLEKRMEELKADQDRDPEHRRLNKELISEYEQTKDKIIERLGP